jgi:hypothetical protein
METTNNITHLHHPNEVNQVLNDLTPHRADFGKIWLYCTENLLNDKKYNEAILNDAEHDLSQNKWIYTKGFEWEICAEIRKELLEVIKKDETYTVLYHFLLSDYAHLDEKYSYTVGDYEKFARQAERAVMFNRYDLAEELEKIENHSEKLTYLVNQRTDYLNQTHKWQDLPEYDYSNLCENEINRLQQLQEIDSLPSKIAPKPPPELSENLLNDLKKERFITTDPLQWHPNKISPCAYFVDCYFSKSNPNDLWKIGETLFNVKNLRQAKNNYLGNKNTYGRPKNFQIIDRIIRKNS